MNQEQQVTVRIQKVKKNRIRMKLIVFAGLATALLLITIFAKYICPYDPYAQDLTQAMQPPSAAHLMGTDTYGRDMLSRVLIGAQTSISSTFALVAIITVFGTVVGIFCGYYGGIVDSVMMRISDVCLAFPGLVFAMAVAAILDGGVRNAVIALALISWPKYSRIARGQTLSIKNLPYMQASQLAGDSVLQMIFRHVLPNIAGPILVTSMLDIGTMMMEIAGLSFLGLGVQAPTPEWGAMLNEAKNVMTSNPVQMIAPGIAIVVLVCVFNLMGDALRDVLDPKEVQK